LTMYPGTIRMMYDLAMLLHILRLYRYILSGEDSSLHRYHFDNFFIDDARDILLNILDSIVFSFGDLSWYLLYSPPLFIFSYYLLYWHLFHPLPCFIVNYRALEWNIFNSALSLIIVYNTFDDLALFYLWCSYRSNSLSDLCHWRYHIDLNYLRGNIDLADIMPWWRPRWWSWWWPWWWSLISLRNYMYD
jgi:hypothetical protein